MTRLTSGLIAVIVCASGPQTLAAQTAHGAVRDSTAGAPLPGAVVLALDSAGGSTARTITDSAGRFALVVAGAERLRVLRIGYVAREIALAGLPSSGAIDVAMVHIPAVLTTVRVAEREVCPSRDDQSAVAAFQLWEQARAGLLGTVVGAATNPMTATTVTYQRRVSASDDVVRQQTVQRQSGFVARPFAAAEPARLANRGYIDEDSTGRTFLAPDAEVLLDESFATTHCFGLRPADAAHGGQVGVTFSPTANRDTLVDVRGVIWLDSGASALRSLEFAYTALEPAAMRANVGGRIDFHTVSNGMTLVERWGLRLPVLTEFRRGVMPARTTASDANRRMTNDGVRVLEIQEAGGQVTDGVWRDGTKWSSPLAGLTGFVRERGRDSPVAGALVSLEGGSDVAVTDATGGFMLAPVIAGRYTASIVDTTLSAYSSPRRTTQVVEVGRGELVWISPRVESVSDVIKDVCKDQSAPRAARIISGHLQPSGNMVASTARLRVAWAVSESDSAVRDVRVDAKGGFVVCAPETSTQIRLRLASGRYESDTTVDVGLTTLTPVEWKPTLRDAMPDSQTRLVRGIVTDSARRPVARVNIVVQGKQSATVATDDSGRFRLRVSNHDAVVLDVRRLGFTPSRLGIDGGGDTSVAVMLLPAVQRLEAVEVTDRAAANANLRGFDERLRQRARGASFGTFITADEIERRSPSQITEMFLEVPYIKVLRGTLDRTFLFGPSKMSPRGPMPCPANVYIDGIRVMEGGLTVNDLVQPTEIAGIEVYRSGGDAPPPFQPLNGNCVVVLIWTK